MYAAEHEGTLPAADGNEVTFKNDPPPHLRGSFPVCTVPRVQAQNDLVKMDGGTGARKGEAAPNKGWK
jgi:hypothetical protein